MRFVLILGLLFFCPDISVAEDSLLQKLYINPETAKKPEAILFYNSANPCENCEKTISLTVSILRRNYIGKLHLYLIDLNRHPEFITAFQIKGPLSLVIVRISDGASFGYTKLEALQSRIINPTLYQSELKSFINNFLGLS